MLEPKLYIGGNPTFPARPARRPSWPSGGLSGTLFAQAGPMKAKEAEPKMRASNTHGVLGSAGWVALATGLLVVGRFEAGLAQAAAVKPTDPGGGATVDGSGWQAVPQDIRSTVKLLVSLETNAATGQTFSRARKITLVGSGLNFRDDAGNLRESKPIIEILPDGSAAAVHGIYRMRFPASLGDGITTTTPSNRVFTSQLLGLYYFDAASGKSALISAADALAPGELLPPNQVIYKGALESIAACVRATYAGSAAEIDLILQERPKAPEYYGLSSTTTRLELWHEIPGLPEPKRKTRVVQSVGDPAARTNMVEPDLVEEILDFGDLWFPQGRSFLASGDQDRDTNTPAKVSVPCAIRDPGVFTAKRWIVQDGRNILIEAVPWLQVKQQLAGLPEMSAATNRERRVFAKRELPPRQKRALSTKRNIEMARDHSAPKGWVLDYIEVPSSSEDGSYTFSSGETYLCDSTTYFSGTLTFESAVIKFTSGAYLLMYGETPIVCNGSPCILTSKDDDNFGETMPDSSHWPDYSAGQALWFYYTCPGTVSGMEVRWANIGMEFDCSSCSPAPAVDSCAFELCVDGIAGGPEVSNSTKCSVPYAADGLTDVCPDDYSVWSTGYIGYNDSMWFDRDGDALANIQEFILGTNPTRAAIADSTGAIGLQLFTPLK